MTCRRLFRPRARRHADIGQAEHALDGRPFAEVVALDAVADPLQEVAGGKSQGGPVPLVPRQREQQDRGDHQGQRNADQVDAVVVAPILLFALPWNEWYWSALGF